MATKFGHLFQKELKHYVLFRRKVERELTRAIRLLKIVRDKSPLDRQILTLADFLLEINKVVTDCFRLGYLSSGLHQLRLAQEVAHKLLAVQIRPSLAKKKRVDPSEVRKVLENGRLPHWKDFYAELSKVTHQHRDFQDTVYPEIRFLAEPTKDNEVFIEFYLMVLNNFNMKALAVILTQLKPHLGGDYRELASAWDKLEPVAAADWESANEKLKAFYKATLRKV